MCTYCSGERGLGIRSSSEAWWRDRQLEIRDREVSTLEKGLHESVNKRCHTGTLVGISVDFYEV